jgi:predicted Rossmann fold flavoprotein
VRVAIIGGGAAGMMAAWSVSQNHPNANIVLFEKNKNLGAKVIISGGGRCNLTTGIEQVSDVLKNYPRGSRFLKHAIYSMPPAQVRDFFENLGVATKCEKDLRVFPVSNNGHDVVDAFVDYFNTTNVVVSLGTQIVNVDHFDGGFRVYKKNDQVECFDKLIITTGGQAYRHTGSSGDGYAFAESLGHTITELGPSLNSFILMEKFFANVSGLSFKNVKLTAKCKDNKKHQISGPILFTHKGLTGPAVFAMSALLAFSHISDDKPLILKLDLLPELSLKDLMSHWNQFLISSPKKYFKHFLYNYVPKSMIELLDNQYNLKMNMPANSLNVKTVNLILEQCKNLHVHITGRGKGDEFVTAGGVCRSDINSKTMQSKITSGLYFAGEIIDVDGVTGGFNLQASWACGNLAGFLLN